MGRRRATGTATVVTALLLAMLAVNLAEAERVQRGELIVSLNGDISPRKLPRDRPAPVALTLEGTIRAAGGAPLPRLRRIELALADGGLLSTRGLPVYPRARLRNASSRQAIERCGPSLVGRGHLAARVVLPHQRPFAIRGRLLAFNGRTADGGVAVWAHTFAADPPVSIVLPFVAERRRGAFGIALVAAISRSVGPWPRLAAFDLTLSRRFRHRGRARSYLSASCPAPEQFTAGFLAIAQATYEFADGRRLRVETVRSCRAL